MVMLKARIGRFRTMSFVRNSVCMSDIRRETDPVHRFETEYVRRIMSHILPTPPCLDMRVAPAEERPWREMRSRSSDSNASSVIPRRVASCENEEERLNFDHAHGTLHHR